MFKSKKRWRFGLRSRACAAPHPSAASRQSAAAAAATANSDSACPSAIEIDTRSGSGGPNVSIANVREMQPPPRKGNYVKFLKNLHAEQINKLILKNQHECDLLEDIRSFIIKRSAIEKSYSEALLKISSAYLNKKIPNIPDIKLDGGEERWNMWNVWRTVLEENEKLARARLAAVEVFQQQIADDAKTLRAHKLQTAKKCIDQLALVQKEVQLSVQEVDKTKKLYFDEEHGAHEVRDKARDIEEKLKKKKGSFFQSITSLQKNSAKFSSKRDQLEEKSSGARNDYLLCLSAANAHQNRYFVVDLQTCMATMEAGVYDKVAEYLHLLGRTELLTCSATQNSFGRVREQARRLTRDYNLQCCYLYYPVLKQHIGYEFEPCDGDAVDRVTADHDSAAAALSKEARRWAGRVARESHNAGEGARKVQLYAALREAGQKVDPNDPNGPDLDTKIEEAKTDVRRAETARAKAEARIECLRAGGVNVDEWMQEAESLNVQDIQRSTSSLSDHPSSDSFYDSDFADGDAPCVIQADVGSTRADSLKEEEEERRRDSDHFERGAEVDAMLEQERQRIEQLTAGWDDPIQVDWGTEDGVEGSEHPDKTPSVPLLKCTALYSYTAQNPDELTIVENEQLEVVGDGDGDGWLRARNYRGEEGFVPQNYLDVEQAAADGGVGGGGGGATLVQQISFSSVDYTVDEEEASQQRTEPTQSPEQVSVVSLPTQKTPDGAPGAGYCVALYDYEGEGGGEELSFEEGQIIRVWSKCAHSVDDGWWQGELDGRSGNFPSLVVEECDAFGEPLTGDLVVDDDETPPVLAPPEEPGAAPTSPPAQPPPPAPGAEEAGAGRRNGEVLSDSGFAMALSRDQHHHYGSQFSPSSSIPTIDVPSVEIINEDGEEVAQTENGTAGNEFGLCAASIVITAATPMVEEAGPFPPADEAEGQQEPSEEEPSEEEEEAPQRATVGETRIADAEEDRHATFVVSSSTGSDEGETTGPSTAENSVSHAPPSVVDSEPKQVVGGRASIPDELEPHQLARLQDLKESNA